ncbi:VPEID-CTERM protein sorting domain-containing protein [Rhodovulum sp. ES.010]|uniref:VPEID-CTERM sorting domain-containing protein n=1 Tax=Rhodovulum sp. ES.010 TaxID=1882821 RepID=UPI00092AE861|nr:VPEID-CTERM sorting domain-containing protein [Rhodovulum sp. ES.010]SIO59748.1 VPEID-CTERM protein sorting domain-containing protein [Rhodovulum sp. ES.010]
MRTLVIAGGTWLAMAGASLAQACDPSKPCSVPEISALEGTAAVAAVAAIVLLAWERRRRAA